MCPETELDIGETQLFVTFLLHVVPLTLTLLSSFHLVWLGQMSGDGCVVTCAGVAISMHSWKSG